MSEAGCVSPWRNYSLEENLDIVVCIVTLEHPYKVAAQSDEPGHARPDKMLILASRSTLNSPSQIIS